MSETQKRTPGPWRVGDNKYDIVVQRGDYPNCGIATTSSGHFSRRELGSIALDREECIANRDFIVLACNSHDDLLAACQAMVAVITEPGAQDMEEWERDEQESIKMGQAAIAIAMTTNRACGTDAEK